MKDLGTGETWLERVPLDSRIAEGTDRHMHVVAPDGSAVVEYFGATRVSTVDYTVLRRAEVDLDGRGIGPQHGVRAYGGSAIGGLIRGWEVDKSDPRYSGVIRHPLAMAVEGSKLFFDRERWSGLSGYYEVGPLDASLHTGWPSGAAAEGFMKQPGYVWPATEQDADSPNFYGGPIPMGSYFAIPASLDLSSVGLRTKEGRMLATAAQDYGVYVTDASAGTTFYCEDDRGPASIFADALLDQDSGHDLRVVIEALRVITNNSHDSPNGGPVGVPRRG
ncbi:hypothetical protein GCM10027511_16090 [Hymenobacter humi]